MDEGHSFYAAESGSFVRCEHRGGDSLAGLSVCVELGCHEPTESQDLIVATGPQEHVSVG